MPEFFRDKGSEIEMLLKNMDLFLGVEDMGTRLQSFRDSVDFEKIVHESDTH